ncbi:DUF86 domain-containing protein [Aerosakkonemataceae cyanobacterium BLCC-F154]|uniref:DUF86 domain-containing protein n=1 Tax=Floridaenema fluviatile BLCC-F154 TaxID=3153640 RepID=A0ABV4Y7R6_9CYAN
MPFRNWQLRIQDIINALHSIQHCTVGMSFEEFEQNEMLIKAILYDFVVIGEAAINIPSEVQSRYPQIPWRLMGDMRNVIAHEYFQVNLRIIWNTIQNNLPSLVNLLQELIQREFSQEE